MNQSLITPEQFRGQIRPLRERFARIFESKSRRPSATIGIGALTHDTSAALVRNDDGAVVFAVAEERLSNVKHDSRFPIGSILRCCEAAETADLHITGVAVNFRPEEFITHALRNQLARSFPEPVCETLTDIAWRLLQEASEPFISEKSDSPVHVLLINLLDASPLASSLSHQQLAEYKLRLSWYFNAAFKYKTIGVILADLFPGTPIEFFNHHDTHAASAYFGIGVQDAAVLVVDGHGESDTTSIFHAKNSELHSIARSQWPHSLGSLYLTATRHLGFDYGDEYKVMGMAAYGKPRFMDEFREMVTVSGDGHFFLNETPLLRLGSVRNSGHVRFSFTESINGLVPQRNKSDTIQQVHFDFAASMQKLTEETGVLLAKCAVDLAGSRQLAIAGGVGLNGLMNEAIRRAGICDDLFIYPASSDDGTSVGAAQASILRSGVAPSRRLQSCYFGHQATDNSILQALKNLKIKYSRPLNIHAKIAEALQKNMIVARYAGGAEFGPRALGHRSILANPSKADMKDTLNLRVKHREEFRPFAPACLREYVGDFFDYSGDAPFMLLILQAKEAARLSCPAVVHSDGTARVQTVTAKENPDFAAIISEFAKLTGVPVVINTSFNVNGETIVNEPRDAIESFGFMDIDCLAIGDYWIEKADNTNCFPIYDDAADYLELRRTRYCERDADGLKMVDVRSYGPWFFPNVPQQEITDSKKTP